MARRAVTKRASLALLTAAPELDEHFRCDLAKLRVVLILLGARRGAKVATARTCIAQFKRAGLQFSLRSAFRWRRQYLSFGFQGIARKRRSDHGRAHFGEDVLLSFIDAAARVRRQGDIAREFRRLKPTVSYETFRSWLRRLQTQIRPQKGADHGLVL